MIFDDANAAVDSPRTDVGRALFVLAGLLIVIKAIEFAIDSTAIFYYDSGSFLMNALGIAFIPERSFTLGYLIRVLALPFHSLRAIVVLQMAMGAVTAWLLAWMLIRFFNVRTWIAIFAALVFACDPVQVVHEHLVLAETGALLASALFFVAGLAYVRTLNPWMLVLAAFLGVLVVAFRIVYVPIVFCMAVLLPLAVLWQPPRSRRALAIALVISCGSTLAFHAGYRSLTGRLAKREPAYHYTTGFFLAAGIAPLIEPQDSDDPRVSTAVMEQQHGSLPLARRDLKAFQLWDPQGLIQRIQAAMGGDRTAANLAAQRLAWHAIARDPVAFVKLGANTYLDFWRQLPEMKTLLPDEDGAVRSSVSPFEAQAIQRAFGSDVSEQHLWQTPSRRFHIWARYWHVFLLVSPLLLIGRIGNPPQAGSLPHIAGVSLLLTWSLLLLIATCLGGVQSAYRFMHPFSFTGLAGAALIAEVIACYCGIGPTMRGFGKRIPPGVELETDFNPRR